MKKTFVTLLAAAVIGVSAPAVAAGGAAHLEQQAWSFDGPFGKFDKASAQRGFQVYREVCSACHSLKRVAFRNLEDLGFSEGQVKALAAEYKFKEIVEGGDEVERPGLPSDYFPSPFANDEEGKAANNGKLPPDLSLMIKARHDGANYVYNLIAKGYVTAPAGVKVGEGLNYNKIFEGNQIGMAPPLNDGQVEYSDGTKNSKDQMTKDVVQFLTWAAEPKLEDRNRMGLVVLCFLALGTVISYLANKRVWRDVKKG